MRPYVPSWLPSARPPVEDVTASYSFSNFEHCFAACPTNGEAKAGLLRTVATRNAVIAFI